MVLFMSRLELENFLTVGIWVISPLSMVNIKTEKEMFLKIKFWPIHQKKIIWVSRTPPLVPKKKV